MPKRLRFEPKEFSHIVYQSQCCNARLLKMLNIIRLLCCVYVCLFVISCSTDTSQSVITPLPNTYNDLSDDVLKSAIRNFLLTKGAPENSTYEFERIDLNNDGRREALVLFSLPHHYWCGWDGCPMAIFQPHEDHFVLLSLINSVRAPVYLPHQQTKGWRDIVLRVSGTRMPDKNVVLRHDGRKYPNTPMLAEDYLLPLNHTEKLFALGR